MDLEIIDKLLKHGADIKLPHKRSLGEWYQDSYSLHYSNNKKYVVHDPRKHQWIDFNNLEDALKVFMPLCEEIGPMQQYVCKDLKEPDCEFDLESKEGIDEMQRLIDAELADRKDRFKSIREISNEERKRIFDYAMECSDSIIKGED